MLQIRTQYFQNIYQKIDYGQQDLHFSSFFLGSPGSGSCITCSCYSHRQPRSTLHWQYSKVTSLVAFKLFGTETNQDLHTDRLLVEMFHNCAFKECISVENLKLWLLTLTKTVFNDHTYKTDIGQHFHKFEKIHQGGATVTKQLIYFSNTDNSTTLTPPGVSREANLSIEFEFGSLVH